MKFLNFAFILLFSFSIIGCFKKTTYPIEPIISEPTVAIQGDSAIVSFTFTDGDGDIGINDNETDPPYDINSYFYYNLYLDYYEKDDINGWQRGMDLAGDSISFKYRIERIEIKGKQRGMKGTIDVAINQFRNPFSSQSDTVKFEIRLIDRALHISNSIETDPL